MTSSFEYASVTIASDLYLEDVCESLAGVFDIGVNVCRLPGQRVADVFIASGMAHEFECQNPVVVAGKSSLDIVEVMLESCGLHSNLEAQSRLTRTPDYWLGWSLGWCQVKTGMTYRGMFEAMSYDELVALYYPLHEAPETKFVEAVRRRYEQARQSTLLQTRRRALGITQTELASRSGVGLRSIQMYEQRNKDINRAQAATLARMALVLHCGIEDLLER